MAQPELTYSQKLSYVQRAAKKGMKIEDYLEYEKDQIQRARCHRRSFSSALRVTARAQGETGEQAGGD